ncbi:MAG: hypothetical protein ACLSVD_13300 [Eggerthellaceae bacterium]
MLEDPVRHAPQVRSAAEPALRPVDRLFRLEDGGELECSLRVVRRVAERRVARSEQRGSQGFRERFLPAVFFFAHAGSFPLRFDASVP